MNLATPIFNPYYFEAHAYKRVNTSPLSLVTCMILLLLMEFNFFWFKLWLEEDFTAASLRIKPWHLILSLRNLNLRRGNHS